MKRSVIALAAALCLLLSGCGIWMDGSYVSVTLHEEQLSGVQTGVVSAANYMELRGALTQMVDSGTESAVINVAEYNQSMVESGISMAVRYLTTMYPLGAYAVDGVEYEVGSSGGKPAVSVNITYIHGRSEIRKVQAVQDMEGAQEKIAQALDACESGVVLLVKAYERTDIAQFVEDYAALHPDIVMETPQVAVGVYPEMGMARVLELKFTYQTSRESLRQMQTQVEPYFASASLYVSGNGSDAQKYAQLYGFLMERYDYKFETSITPAYSLLCHGVGDGAAFATVYAAMCRQAGLDCRVGTGTRAGEPWWWNMVCDNGTYYHVDLLQCNAAGGFRELTATEMEGYVWDYSAYEPSAAAETEPENNH